MALEDHPNEIGWNAALGRLLLIAGRSQLAGQCLARVSCAAPHLVHSKILLARALRANGEFDAAADLMAGLDQNQIADNFVARRQVISALSLAGRKDEAAERYDALLLEREETLPTDFSSGLAELDSRIDDVRLPESRFDWAWSMRDPSLHADRVFDHARAEGAGIIIASAHVGALYAGPLALELLGIPARWLASTPSLGNAPYRSSLISTSDQTEAQVARSVIRAMNKGDAVVLAVDGAMSMSAPRVSFEGREVTYSAFAARLAYKRDAISFFSVPYWTSNEQLDFYTQPMPRVMRGENEVEFSRRWRTDYFAHVRTFLTGRPENLRMSGGIWRTT